VSVAPATLALPAPTSAPDAAPACAHCGAPSRQPGARFCCHGCEAAAGLVAGLGLEAFYRRRRAAPGSLRPAGAAADDVTAFVDESGGLCRLQLHVDGLDCGACVWLAETALGREAAVEQARVNFSTRRLSLAWRGPASLGQVLADRLAALGFRVAPFDGAAPADAQARQEAELLRAMAIAGFAAANVMLFSVSVWSGHAGSMGPATRDLLHWASALVALPAIAVAGLPFFRSALQALAAGRTNMDVPISVGVVLAAAMSLFETVAGRQHAFFDSAITLLFFLLVGRYLDVRARGRARQAAQHVVALAARAVRVLTADGRFATRTPRQVTLGDVVLVASGERIPVDGEVTRGEGLVDQSVVTGEATPVPAPPGSAVFAGAINLGAAIEIRTTAAGDDTLLAEIARLMEAAERGQGRIVALADRVARLYAPVVHVAAAATFLGWWMLLAAPVHTALLHAAAVLIITCPCALALAVPVVQVVASGRLMRRGILMKSATALERLAAIDTVVLDKTGTLTLGRPVLVGAPGIAAGRAAAGLAQASRHPLARALVRAFPDSAMHADVEEVPGSGLRVAMPDGEWRLGSRAFCGVGDAATSALTADRMADEASLELWFARPGVPPQRFAFADALRPDAGEAIAALRARGLSIMILSGDRAPAVAAVAARLGIEAWDAGLKPDGKLARLQALAREGRNVAMIGDGLNDAPALAAAGVSLSPGDGTDIARVAADFVFQGERLGAVVAAFDAACAAQRVARQNLALALGYNALAVPLAVCGFVTPLVAAIAMSSSSVLVIANALRLARGRVSSWTRF
jgi:Cu2+-exporting ATPase